MWPGAVGITGMLPFHWGDCGWKKLGQGKRTLHEMTFLKEILTPDGCEKNIEMLPTCHQGKAAWVCRQPETVAFASQWDESVDHGCSGKWSRSTLTLRAMVPHGLHMAIYMAALNFFAARNWVVSSTFAIAKTSLCLNHIQALPGRALAVKQANCTRERGNYSADLTVSCLSYALAWVISLQRCSLWDPGWPFSQCKRFEGEAGCSTS